jgi:hypothetical protein
LLWRLWCFVSGLPLGLAVALAIDRSFALGPSWLAWGALAGGALLASAGSLLARRRNDEEDRGRHLAAAASAAWVGVPVGAAIVLGFAPGPWPWGVLALVVVGLALSFGARAIGPAGSLPGWLGRGLAAAGLGAAAVLVLGAAGAAARGAGAVRPAARWSETVYDLDARVATRALPRCGPAPRGVQVLLERGAHPSLGADGGLWFDAAVADEGGRRQIHRLDPARGDVTCWTCGEPGHNVRPSASGSGRAVVFETDRHATWWRPDDTEVQLLRVRTSLRPEPSRRLTFSPGPDERPLVGPGGALVAWSRRAEGRYEVVAAAVRTGHGGLLLGTPGVLATGGAEWVAPLAWSPDGRALVVGRGNPFAPLEAVRVDPATGESTSVGIDVAAASFSADGGWLVRATAQGAHRAGALPSALGVALGPWASALSRRAPLRRGTGLVGGPTAEAQAAAALDLPADVAAWGEPTGLALAPDASRVVLGQRRRGAAGSEERLLALELDCAPTALAAAGAGDGR